MNYQKLFFRFLVFINVYELALIIYSYPIKIEYLNPILVAFALSNRVTIGLIFQKLIGFDELLTNQLSVKLTRL